MEKHAKKIHLNCTVCDYTSVFEKKLKIHVETVHQKAIKAHKCQDCNTIFSTKPNLSRHVNRVHLKIKPSKKFICEKCDAPFEQKKEKEHHMNRVHLNVKPYECNFCQKAFFIKAQLKTHLKRSHEEEEK